MANNKADVEYKSIDEMRTIRHTTSAIFSGACSAKGWRAGKMVTAEEYDAAVKEFGDAPMGGKAAAKGGKKNAS